MKREKNAVLRFLSRFSRLIYQIIATSFIGRLFTSYGACNEAIVGVRGKRAERGRTVRRYTVRRAIACAMEQNIFSLARRRCVAALVASSLRTIGFFLTVLGGVWISLYGVSLFVSLGAAVSWNHLIAGGISLLVGVLLLFSDRSLGGALRHGSLLGFLLFDVFGLHDDLVRDTREKGAQHFLFSAVLALLFAALGLLIAPAALFAILAALFGILVILSVPEVGFLLAILVLPFSKLLIGSDALTLICLTLMVFGYFGKLLRGNRAFRVELQDIPVFLLLLLFFLSVRTPARGSVLKEILIEVLLAVTYLIVVNILSTPHWLSVSRNAFAASAFGACVVGIVQLVYAMLNSEGASFANIATFGSAVTAGFADHTAFAYYLVLAFAFVLPAIPFSSKRRRALPVIVALFLLVGVLLTFVSAALLALLLIAVLFLLIYEYRSMPFVVVGGGAVGGTLLLLPGSVRGNVLGIFRDLADPARVTLRQEGRVAVSRMLFGSGEGIFSKSSSTLRLIFGAGHRGLFALHPYFAELSVSFGYGAYHFWQVLLVDYGIIGVLACAWFFFLLLQNCFSVLAMSVGRERSLYAYIGIVLVAALIFFGFFHYVWYDQATLAAFFFATALVGAAMRHDRMRREKTVMHEEYGRPAAEIDYRARAKKA